MKKRNILIAALFITGGVILGRTMFQPAPPEPVYLPAETVTVEVVPPLVLAELASRNDALAGMTLDNKELRDKYGRLLEVNAMLRVETEPSPAPAPAIDIIREACIEQEVADLEYTAKMEAWRFRGLNVDHELSEGWTGRIRCEVRSADSDWTFLVDEPFTLSNTVAVSTTDPVEPQRVHRYFMGIHYSVLLNSTYTQFDDFTSVLQPTNIRVYGGLHMFPRKKRVYDIGLFADSDSAGVTLGLTW